MVHSDDSDNPVRRPENKRGNVSLEVQELRSCTFSLCDPNPEFRATCAKRIIAIGNKGSDAAIRYLVGSLSHNSFHLPIRALLKRIARETSNKTALVKCCTGALYDKDRKITVAVAEILLEMGQSDAFYSVVRFLELRNWDKANEVYDLLQKSIDKKKAESDPRPPGQRQGKTKSASLATAWLDHLGFELGRSLMRCPDSSGVQQFLLQVNSGGLVRSCMALLRAENPRVKQAAENALARLDGSIVSRHCLEVLDENGIHGIVKSLISGIDPAIVIRQAVGTSFDLSLPAQTEVCKILLELANADKANADRIALYFSKALRNQIRISSPVTGLLLQLDPEIMARNLVISLDRESPGKRAAVLRDLLSQLAGKDPDAVRAVFERFVRGEKIGDRLYDLTMKFIANTEGSSPAGVLAKQALDAVDAETNRKYGVFVRAFARLGLTRKKQDAKPENPRSRVIRP